MDMINTFILYMRIYSISKLKGLLDPDWSRIGEFPTVIIHFRSYLPLISETAGGSSNRPNGNGNVVFHGRLGRVLTGVDVFAMS